jgi:N-acetylglucosaminyldiphosphoundecaprenol N-acetyl-beta-D-mannosaminyltransferase
LFIAGPNAYIIVLAEDNLRFREAMQSADLLLADGISIVIASILLGRRLPERIPGGEVMEQMCRLAALHGLRVYFLGGLEGAAEQAALVLSSRYPGLTFAGTYCPPIGFERDLVESQKVRELIMASKPDMLFVALGSPKQEIWMAENCQYFAVRTIMSVGAAFDTQAGLRKRAPQWAQKTGTEWLYRLIMEPRRLWKRYLIGNFRFMLLILRQIRTRRQ